jgi:hypothetical protein
MLLNRSSSRTRRADAERNRDRVSQLCPGPTTPTLPGHMGTERDAPHPSPGGGPQCEHPSGSRHGSTRRPLTGGANAPAGSCEGRSSGKPARPCPRSVSGTTLVIRQPNAEITVDERGSVRVSRPARDAGGWPGAGIPSLVEEDVRERVADAIRYAGWLLDRIDPTHRLSRVALVCRLDGVGYLPWRTRGEVAASPNQASMGGASQAEDITVRLRRQAAG